jgi:hypothetical protein
LNSTRPPGPRAALQMTEPPPPGRSQAARGAGSDLATHHRLKTGPRRWIWAKLSHRETWAAPLRMKPAVSPWMKKPDPTPACHRYTGHALAALHGPSSAADKEKVQSAHRGRRTTPLGLPRMGLVVSPLLVRSEKCGRVNGFRVFGTMRHPFYSATDAS